MPFVKLESQKLIFDTSVLPLPLRTESFHPSPSFGEALMLKEQNEMPRRFRNRTFNFVSMVSPSNLIFPTPWPQLCDLEDAGNRMGTGALHHFLCLLSLRSNTAKVVKHLKCRDLQICKDRSFVLCIRIVSRISFLPHHQQENLHTTKLKDKPKQSS